MCVFQRSGLCGWVTSESELVEEAEIVLGDVDAWMSRFAVCLIVYQYVVHIIVYL